MLPLCALSGVPFSFLLSSYRDPAQPRHTWVEAFGVGGVIPTLKDRYETQPALSLSRCDNSVRRDVRAVGPDEAPPSPRSLPELLLSVFKLPLSLTV